jgi:hypothetical protein
MIKPAADINLDNAEPSARTKSNVAALRHFIAAACEEYTAHSTYLHRVVSHVSKQGLSKQTQREGENEKHRAKDEKEKIKRTLGQARPHLPPFCDPAHIHTLLTRRRVCLCASLVLRVIDASVLGHFLFVNEWGEVFCWYHSANVAASSDTCLLVQ